MQGIELSRVQFIWYSGVQRPERLKDEPPIVNVELEHLNPELQDEIERSATRRARKYDYYTDVEYIGVLQDNTCTHYAIPANVDDVLQLPNNPVAVNTGYKQASSLVFLQDEAQVLERFWYFARPEHGAMILAGWQIDQWLPTLLSKAMQYGITVPDDRKADPLKRFNTVDGLLTVETLYTQNIRSPMRPVPALAEMLDWWGAQHPTGLAYPKPAQLRALTTEQWIETGCKAAEKYLRGMQEIVARYYGYAHTS